MTDTYLLFSELPYDFQTDLPLSVGGGVWLSSADEPQRIIREAEDAERLQVMLIPEQMCGLGQLHVCLHRAHGVTRNTRQATSDLWHGMLALRLALPFRFRTSGTLTFDGQRVLEFSRGELCSAAEPSRIHRFDGGTVEHAARINRRITQIRGRGLERARSAFTLFSHISLGSVSSWQLAMLGLFCTLECVFPQPAPRQSHGLDHGGETYGQRLARRVATFLPNDLRPRQLRRFIESEYHQARNPLAHGFHIPPARNFGTTRQNAARFMKLHETARLTLLGVLGMNNATLQVLLPAAAQGVAVQNQIDGIGCAPLTFLHGQRFWSVT